MSSGSWKTGPEIVDSNVGNEPLTKDTVLPMTSLAHCHSSQPMCLRRWSPGLIGRRDYPVLLGCRSSTERLTSRLQPCIDAIRKLSSDDHFPATSTAKSSNPHRSSQQPHADQRRRQRRVPVPVWNDSDGCTRNWQPDAAPQVRRLSSFWKAEAKVPLCCVWLSQKL